METKANDLALTRVQDKLLAMQAERNDWKERAIEQSQKLSEIRSVLQDALDRCRADDSAQRLAFDLIREYFPMA